VWFVGGHDLEVGSLSVVRHIGSVDEVHCIGAADHGGQVALGKTSKLDGASFFPEVAFGTFERCFIFGVEAGVRVNSFVNSGHPGSIIAGELNSSMLESSASDGLHREVRGEECMGRELGIEGKLGWCLHEWLRRQFGLINCEQERIEGGCSGDKQGALPAGIAMPPLDL
jgi:hypothetical protein